MPLHELGLHILAASAVLLLLPFAYDQWSKV
jgi:hypothetical protein